ncbi:12150_t:CDS:2 [Dentiscutata heterogama]|uniref:12150_t:CDS:1 n=1 Tax=Dentiscutata heterogama TaxID=1316150 RepID=A0ACA9K319_9GLOM|nr:12150_t:CDS:2 [Dentiscutata heterogama]
MPTTSTLTHFRCTICNSKRTFKSKAGLQRHESLKYYNYKKIPAHILLVPEHEFHHIKNTMVKELQKRLKNHYSKVGKQVFSIHCSENSFVDIFGQYLTRYSVCGGWYQCFFDGEEAIDQLTEIFGDNQWAERNYGNGQLSWIKLYENELITCLPKLELVLIAAITSNDVQDILELYSKPSNSTDIPVPNGISRELFQLIGGPPPIAFVKPQNRICIQRPFIGN